MSRFRDKLRVHVRPRRRPSPVQVDDAAAIDAMEAQLRTLTPAEIKALAADPSTKAVLGRTVSFNPKQRQALDLLSGPARFVLLHGGARSSKTFNIVCATIERALQCPSRHVILRLHHSDVVRSVGQDTLPKALRLCYPGLEYKLNKSDWIFAFPNGSEIYLAGLDTAERMEKILGLEFSTLHLNEISQLTYSAMQFSRHRLAQRTELVNKIYADCNPPGKRHWGHLIFIEKRNPENGQPLLNPDDYAEMRLNPIDNEENVAEGFIDDMRTSFGTRDQQRYVDGIWADDAEGSLFPAAVLDRYRIDQIHAPPAFERKLLAVDPSGARGEEDLRSDEIGIILLGMSGGHAFVLADHSGRYSPLDWGQLVVDIYTRDSVDAIVVETNYGAALATATIKAAAANSGVSPRIVEVSASRAKHVRAEPVSTLYEKGLVHHVGRFADLEAQLGDFSASGYAGSRSPDRADAAIWGVTELMPRMLSFAKRSRASGGPQWVHTTLGSRRVGSNGGPSKRQAAPRVHDGGYQSILTMGGAPAPELPDDPDVEHYAFNPATGRIEKKAR